MSGVYIHIPFCRQKCHYCNFHFAVSRKHRQDLIDALIREIELNHSFLPGKNLDSLYFGGGTPSLLPWEDIQALILQVKAYFELAPGSEITLEANPDDLDPDYLEALKETGINRLSLGVQSFMDDELLAMNRVHDSREARKAIKMVLEAGFSDLSIDLIFGMPGSSIESWRYNLEQALEYPIPHFSCYNLTIEKRTALHHFVRSGRIIPLPEALMAEQFRFTEEFLANAGYEHYEISNYALPGRYARHNTSYWMGKPYLGIGPSAHSFNGRERQWNVSSNVRYIRSIREDIIPAEREILTPADRYNEYIMTGLRTQWGCDPEKIKEFGPGFYSYFEKHIPIHMKKGRVVQESGRYVLTGEGRLFADEVASELFY